MPTVSPAKEELQSSAQKSIKDEAIVFLTQLSSICSAPLEEISDEEELSTKNYRVLKDVIGRGEFSVIYKAEALNGKEEKTLAAKVLNLKNNEKHFQSKYPKRYASIVRLLNKKHPNVLVAYDVFKIKDNLYVFTDYCENGSLQEYLKFYDDAPVGPKMLKRWTRNLASAIEYLHNVGIAHRNIKPQNILLTSNWRVKLTGFFFARPFVNLENGKRKVSRSKRGQSAFIPPEVHRGSFYNPKKVDIFSFGSVVYLMITGNKFVYDPDNIDETHLGVDIEIIAKATNDEFANLIKQCTAHYPDIRPNIKKVKKCSWLEEHYIQAA
ncbi:testis-specific serine/threonine-protein kinase 1-like protein [Dinothrombium tinctorium]|uniref:Testis-specific serine/threonine-protein kinase 1-like protein n=1 Tax=Dinothrombium tinctorium TaxID=1965070 RepID=A0A443RLH4_9ACAR|nr:testis-specific serine/threonine-protein kinase 1-like protein [Dinothrombium tinctorium]